MILAFDVCDELTAPSALSHPFLVQPSDWARARYTWPGHNRFLGHLHFANWRENSAMGAIVNDRHLRAVSERCGRAFMIHSTDAEKR